MVGKLNQALSPQDPSSYSRPGNNIWKFYIIVIIYLFLELAVVTNIILSLSINFDKRTLIGKANLTVQKSNSDINEVVCWQNIN